MFNIYNMLFKFWNYVRTQNNFLNTFPVIKFDEVGKHVLCIPSLPKI